MSKSIELSHHAKELYERLLAGEFYQVWGGKRVPRAMDELEKAGLVKHMMRVKTVVACFVPAHAIPYKEEIINPGVTEQ